MSEHKIERVRVGDLEEGDEVGPGLIITDVLDGADGQTVLIGVNDCEPRPLPRTARVAVFAKDA